MGRDRRSKDRRSGKTKSVSGDRRSGNDRRASGDRRSIGK